jgi:hypothetical protein
MNRRPLIVVTIKDIQSRGLWIETMPAYCRFSSLSDWPIARSAALIASARLKATPVLGVRPPRSNDHFQPYGLIVWTNVYSTH